MTEDARLSSCDLIPETVKPEHYRVDTTYASLSETQTNPATWYQFAAGGTLAQIHETNVLVRDWRASAVAFNLATGRATPLDLSSSGIAEPTVENTAGDFAVPLRTMSSGEFFAFLAGYVDACREGLEHRQRGYVRKLLDALDVRVDDLASPRDAFTNLDDVMAWLGADVQLSGAQCRLRPVSPSSDTPAADLSPDDLTIALAGLVVAGVDLSRLDPGGVGQPGSAARAPAAGMLEQLVSRSPLSVPADGLSAIAVAAARVLRQVQSDLGYPCESDPSYRMQAMKAVNTVVQSLPGDVALSLHDAFVDVLDDVSVRAARVEREASREPVVSQALAQSALITISALQKGMPIGDARIVTLLSRHGSFHWRPSMTNETMNAKELASLSWLEFSGRLVYLQTKAMLFRALFVSSMQRSEGRNPRWSCAWRALRLLRELIKAMAWRIKDPTTTRAELKQIAVLRKVLVGHHADTLESYVATVKIMMDEARSGQAVWLPAGAAQRFEAMAIELRCSRKLAELAARRFGGKSKINAAHYKLVTAINRACA